MTQEHGSVLFDLIGAQSSLNRDRGIARYIAELALAFDRQHPKTIRHFLVDRRLTVPGSLDGLVGSGRAVLNLPRGPGGRPPQAPFTYVVGSLFEFGHPLDALIPRYVRLMGDARLVVILYDLIPLLFSDRYLTNAQDRASYEARLEMLRTADLILAISEATRRDAVDHLGLAPERVITIMGGVSGMFQPAVSRDRAFALAKSAIPDLEERFVFYTGGVDFRKNIEGLIAGFADIDQSLRSQNQLVITCKIRPEELNYFEGIVEDHHVVGRVLFTGYVPDHVLQSLYQSTQLFVFPSIYEGFGLPVAEALVSGAITVGSNRSSIPEILDDEELLFDPLDHQDIARAITLGLTDAEIAHRSFRLGSRAREKFTWDRVADTAAEALRGLEAGSRPRRSGHRRSTVALVTPWPPQRSGVADYSKRLALAMQSAGVTVDIYAPSNHGEFLPAEDTSALRVARISQLDACDRLSPYHARLYCMGNSSFHGGIYELALDEADTVLAHDVRLTGFYGWYRVAGGHPPEWFRQKLLTLHPGLDPSIGSDGWLSDNDADLWGAYMIGELLNASRLLLVHSHYSLNLVRLLHPDLAHRVRTTTFGHQEVSEHIEPERPTVSTYGVAAPPKMVHSLVAALPRVLQRVPDAMIRIAGPIDGSYRRELEASAASLGVLGAIEFTEDLDEQAFEAALRNTTIAVQLRSHSNGETSAAIGDCLSHGIPTIVTDIGSIRDLPPNVVKRVPRHAEPALLANAITDLLQDSANRSRMQRAATEYAAANSFRRAAEDLLGHLLS